MRVSNNTTPNPRKRCKCFFYFILTVKKIWQFFGSFEVYKIWLLYKFNFCKFLLFKYYIFVLYVTYVYCKFSAFQTALLAKEIASIVPADDYSLMKQEHQHYEMISKIGQGTFGCVSFHHHYVDLCIFPYLEKFLNLEQRIRVN